MATFAQTTLSRAEKFARHGQFDQAEQAYNTLLARFPANRRAKAGLLKIQKMLIDVQRPAQADLARVAVALRAGEFANGDAGAKMLLARFPNDAVVNNLAGVAAAACGQRKRAIKHYTRAVEIDPQMADALFNLGKTHRELGAHQAALDAYGALIQITPDYPMVYNDIGVSLAELGQRDGAIVAFEQAIRLGPDGVEAHRNLGKQLYEQRDFAGAIAAYTRAVAIDGGCADTMQALGLAYYDNDQLGRAIETMERAIALRPDFAAALNNLGGVLRGAGQPDKAQACFERALTIDPAYTEAHYNLGRSKKFQPDDPQIAVLEGLEAGGGLGGEQRMYMFFALAKAHADLGDIDRSFACLDKANNLRRGASGYNIQKDHALFQTIKYAFRHEVPALVSGERKGPVPVFILGMPRSGTTLTEQILASHSDVQGGGELEFLAQTLRDGAWVSDAPHPENLRAIRQGYYAQLDGIAGGGRFITDKMPVNFRLAGFILTALPEAKIIHTKRDARATCWSILSQYFAEKGNGNGFAYDQVEVATYYRMYLDMMAYWQARFPGRIYDLSYEQLTENQEEETRGLLAHVGVNWEAQCLEFQSNKRTVKTASAAQVREKMYQGSSDKWREFAAHLGPMIKILDGY